MFQRGASDERSIPAEVVQLCGEGSGLPR